MKKQKLMIAISILFALTLTGTITIPTLYAQSDDEPTTAQTATQGGILDVLERVRQAQAQQLEGSWTAVATPVVPPGAPQLPSTNSYLTFARGGALISTARVSPFSSPGHGVWEHLGGNSFALTFKQDIFDGMGNFMGVLTGRSRLTFTGKDEFTGITSGERRDANGNLLFAGCGAIRGTRLKVEPVPEQCQNLTLSQ